MKKLTLLTVTLLLTALVQLTAPPVQAEVSIPDANLAAAIRETLGLPTDAAITAHAMRNLTRLDARGKGITALTGLERATNLTSLYLSDTWVNRERHTNPISDVSPLAGLTQLRVLSLGWTAVWDVSPLANLTQLTWLYLWNTAVWDVSPLANLTQLTRLYLSDTAVWDVSPLAGLPQLEGLYLSRTAVWDVSPLANLTQLTELYLRDTAVWDVSPLANLTQLETLHLQDNWLNAVAHHTHIPAIQANGTEVAFDPFQRLHLPQVPWLVSLIYFLPSDKPVRPNVDAEIDGLIKKVQRFFADEMERHGFGRKTFQFEADANGNAVVHHINGNFPYARYQQNVHAWDHEINTQVYIPGKNFTVIMIDTFGEETLPGGLCGQAGGSRHLVGGSVDIYCWNWRTIAHELGHAFGMFYHDFRDNRYIMSYGGADREELSPCFAAWLDVHPAFNPTVVLRGTYPTTQVLPATLAAPPNAIRLRFTVTAPAGSLYQARLVTPEKRKHAGDAFNSGGLIGCKRIDGNPTSSTVEFVTALAPDTESVSVTLHIIGIDGDSFGLNSFSIPVGSLADVNGDGMVDPADLAIVSQIVAQTMGKPVENPQADVNGDDVVDGEDFALVAAHLGEGEAAAPSQAALPAGLTREKVEWALNILHTENTGSPAFRRGIAKLEGFLARLIPDKTLLLANYPNPFNPETWIPYQLSAAAEVTVTIHSSDGKLVRTLELGQVPAGVYSDRDRAAYWDGRNAQGEPVASGVYFYTLSAGDFSATRKMVIRK